MQGSLGSRGHLVKLSSVRYCSGSGGENPHFPMLQGEKERLLAGSVDMRLLTHNLLSSHVRGVGPSKKKKKRKASSLLIDLESDNLDLSHSTTIYHL